MGVSTEIWRSRIGSFNAVSMGQSSTGGSSNGGRDFFILGFSVLHILTICALLSIGGVEANPGPKFQCQVCLSKPEFDTISECILHQKIHAVDKHFLFTCPACSLQFATFNALDLHVHYYHGDTRNIPQTEHTVQACIVPGCNKLFPSTKLLCQHLKKDHQEQGVKTQCPLKQDCKSENYFSKQTFSVHLSQQHKGWNSTSSSYQESVDLPALTTENLESAATDDCSDADMDIFINEATSNVSGSDVEDVPQIDPLEEKLNRWSDEFYRSLAMLYLRLEALHLVPVTTIDVIAKSLAQLTATNLSIMREVMVKEFKAIDLPEDVKERAMNSICSADKMFAAHHKDAAGPTLTTNALRKSYYKSHFAYIKPKEINLSRDPNNRRCIYYCKIQKTLGLSLMDAKIEKEVAASFTRESKEGIFEDYKDGSLHKRRKEKHPEKCIDLLIFQDEFTPTKDLSSVANQYKILGMYYTIGNLPPHLRAKLDCKRMIMLVPNSKAMFADFKLGLFKVVVKELMKLQSTGIRFMEEQVKVRLRFLLGDNKGQHEIGGFIQSFSHEYFCRYCPMSKTEINAEPWKVGPLRTAESYEEASLLVPADRSTYMGVSRPEWQCPFNKLEDFHVCDPSLCPCLGHDINLGVINYDLSLIIQHLVVKKKWFTYQQLNRKIKVFKYHGHDSGNKPAPVKYEQKTKKNTDAKEKKEPSLGGHAIQNWTLLRLLPFILDEEFIKDCNDPYWRLYLSLKEITDILSAPSITLDQLGRLKVMMEEYQDTRKDLLGDGKPKHHYAAHFPDLISILGPLVHLSGLGFEQFHQFFKNAARAGKNFVELGLSLAKKYCLYLAYLSSSSLFVTGVKILEPGVTVSMQKAIGLDKDFETAINSRNISDGALIMKRIEVDDLLFKEGQWLLLGNQSDTEIVVGNVTCVVLEGNSVFLMLRKHIATYLSDFGIYVIGNNSTELICIPRDEIQCPLPQSIYEWGRYERCFSLKHSLSNSAPLPRSL